MTAAALITAALEMWAPAHAGHAPQTCNRARLVAVVAPAILVAAEVEDIDPLLLAALVARESGFRPAARGRRGELGLGQIAPVAARALGVRLDQLEDHATNLRVVARLLARARARCGGTVSNWLGSYNRPSSCGPSRYARRVLRLVARGRAA